MMLQTVKVSVGWTFWPLVGQELSEEPIEKAEVERSWHVYLKSLRLS